MCGCLGLCACLFLGGSIIGYFAMKECHSLQPSIIFEPDDKMSMV